ncbi:ISKra4 family transposase, partial [Citrobacter sp. AAK_AS5]
MAAMVTRSDGDTLEVSVSLSLRCSMLDMEEAVQEALNGAGRAVMAEALARFDTDGSP